MTILIIKVASLDVFNTCILFYEVLRMVYNFLKVISIVGIFFMIFLVGIGVPTSLVLILLTLYVLALLVIIIVITIIDSDDNDK